MLLNFKVKTVASGLRAYKVANRLRRSPSKVSMVIAEITAPSWEERVKLAEIFPAKAGVVA